MARNFKQVATFSGVDFFTDRLKNLANNVDAEILASAEEAAELIIERAQELMDSELEKGKWYYEHDDATGEPAREMFSTHVAEVMGDRVRVKVQNNSSHFAYLEFGTRPHEILPLNKNGVLRFQHPEGDFHFVKFIEEVSGVPEFAFIQRAVKDTKAAVRQLFVDNFNKYIEGTTYRTAVRRRARRKARKGDIVE